MQPFTYDLPEEFIAQRPTYPPDSAKLLVVERATGKLTSSIFSEVSQFLPPNSEIVLNESKVIPARLLGQLNSGAKIEILLIKEITKGKWECLGKPLKKLPTDSVIIFSDKLQGKVLERTNNDTIIVQFSDAEGVLEHGLMPIPPYIREGLGDAKDKEDYQTLFAKVTGSIAAPTASLHFTDALLKDLAIKHSLSFLTLHVGTASFRPVILQDGSLRPPESENFIIDPKLIENLLASKNAGRRVCAVGTTVVRALESAGLGLKDKTELFIQPGYTFKIVDLLVTNFHQPGTTHLLLVEALLGKELLQEAYSKAIKEKYRFLSYGDAMLIID